MHLISLFIIILNSYECVVVGTIQIHTLQSTWHYIVMCSVYQEILIANSVVYKTDCRTMADQEVL